ncbi:MAG: ABC transporter substrate-binding protein [Ruminococcaceae bacterium]|nr:ABC transporter substrate-binding protein [Oscillospiraceae bacterium]
MSKSRRILAMALSAAMGLTMLAGCSNDSGSSTPGNNNSTSNQNTSNDPTSTGDASKGKVYWLNFKPELDETALALAKTYQDKTGVAVKVVTAASGTYEQQLLSEMDKNEPPTMFVIGKPTDAEKWKDYALDLTGSKIANALNTNDMNVYSSDGKLVSVPYCYECYGIVVNKDLVTQAGYNVDDIKGFDKLKEVAEDIHARSAELGFDAFAASDLSDANHWRITGHMVNLEYFYEQKDNHWTETPATISGEYMDNFKQLFDLTVNNSCTEPKDLVSAGNDPVAQFKQKKAAFVLTGSWDAADIKGAGIDATMIPYYCGVSGEDKAGLNCGTENCWAINSKVSADDQAATMDFMVWLVTDPDASAKLVNDLGVLPYTDAAASDNAFLAAANKLSDDGCYAMNWATNYQPPESAYRPPIASALHAYVVDQSDANWANVKAAIVDGWAAAQG